MAAVAAALSFPLSFCISQAHVFSSKRARLYLPRNSPSISLRRTEAWKRRDSPSVTYPRTLHVDGSLTTPKEEEEFSVLTSIKSSHNDIVIIDTPKSRFLLLDSTHNIHSIYNKGPKWTGAYWDEFASLPAIVPQGPIAILGLGGGTAAHLMLDLWPSLKLEGWEIDEILLDKAREYLGLSELEKVNQAGGVLNVHVGDAFSPSAVVPGGFAGIVVDLFSDGKVLPQLQEVTTWLELNKRLMPHGRIMVNCAGAHSETANISDGAWLSWKRMTEGEGENFLALTGPTPDLNAWSMAVPGPLSSNVTHWRPCQLAG
ncbi:uncharacterized protein LOC131232589 isoform X2 [Magnolia sinica]|uniref:uncharacterized protein LOC131232589 isoform X2 n=1 Tax=Magnolia sinica TaxID=86752 RepID=UPI00265900DB|nr:uncharacterized protein LOC131232589 isoform X2 [Magnolia sinica]